MVHVFMIFCLILGQVLFESDYKQLQIYDMLSVFIMYDNLLPYPVNCVAASDSMGYMTSEFHISLLYFFTSQ